MIAHGPYPSAAAPMPTTAPAAVAAIILSSRLRNRNSRTSSASWADASAVRKKLSESTASNGATAGSP